MEILKFLIIAALILFGSKKLMAAIKNKTLTWDTVKKAADSAKDTIGRMESSTKRNAHTITAIPELTGAEEFVLIKGQPCSVLTFFLTCFLITAFPLLLLSVVNNSFLTGLLAVVISGIVYAFLYLIAYMILEAQMLVVTTKRVYYRFAYRKVDLPLDFVTATGTNLFHIITISTPSGVIRIPLIKNNEDIHEIIVNLLIARQSGIKVASPTKTIKSDPPAAPAPAPAPAPPPTPAPTVPASQEPAPVAAPVSEAPKAVPQTKPATPAAPVSAMASTASPAREAASAAARRRSAVPSPAADVKATGSQQAATEGFHIGRCVMCRKTEIPVKTVSVMISGIQRKRTLCEKCAEKHGAK